MATAKKESGFTDDWQGEKTLAECNLQMLKSADTCDVIFRVGLKEDIVRAHRYILISRSCVFYSMLCSDWSKEISIKIPNVSKEFITEFLNFLYTDDCSLTADNVTGLLYLSKKYAVHRLHRLCLSFLQTKITPKKACVVLEQAHFYDEDQLFKQALTIVTTNGNVSLMTEGFRDLCHCCLSKVIISNNLDLNTKPEVLFNGIMSWASGECSRQGKEITPENQRDVLGETLYLIGFTGFEAQTFVKEVIPTRIIGEVDALEILAEILCPRAKYTDVGRFRNVDIIYRHGTVVLHEQAVYIYENYNQDSVVSCHYGSTADNLDLSCDQVSVLRGIVVEHCEAKVNIIITQADNILMNIILTITPVQAKIYFPFKVEIKPDLVYNMKINKIYGKFQFHKGKINLMENVVCGGGGGGKFTFKQKGPAGYIMAIIFS